MVDRAVEGRTGPEYEVRVELGKVREFARATKTSHPAYLDADMPVVPPTFLITSGPYWEPPGSNVLADANLDLRRILHGEQEFVFHGPPPRADARLRAQARVESVFEKEGKRGGTMTFLVNVTEYRDETGKVVAEARSTLIETARPPKEEA